MNIKLLTEHYLEFLSLKGASQARLRLQLPICHIVGNHWTLIKYCRLSLYCEDPVSINNISQNFITLSCFLFPKLANGDFRGLLITFANSLEPDQDRQDAGPDLIQTV